jgi:hypothetical protein
MNPTAACPFTLARARVRVNVATNTLFSRLDETLAYCADDAEMSLLCAHTNNFACRLPFGSVAGNSTVARLRRRLTGEDHPGPALMIALELRMHPG